MPSIVPIPPDAQDEDGSADAVICQCGEPVGHAQHCEHCCGCGVASEHEYMAQIEHLRRCPICDTRFGTIAEFQHNALEMARKADAAERRAEEAEFHVEQLTEARDRAERQAGELEAVLAQVRQAFNLQCPPMPIERYVDRGAWMAHSWWDTVLGGILRRAEWARPEAPCPVCGGSMRFCECMDDPFAPVPTVEDECPGLCGEHHWLDRPESDTRECLICGAEVAG